MHKTETSGIHTWVGKITWRRAWQPTPGFLPGASHGQRNLAGYSPWSCKESDMTEATYHTCTQIPSTLGLLFTCRDPEGLGSALRVLLWVNSKETFIFSPRGDRGNNPVKRKQTQRFLWTVGGCEAM